MPVLQCILKNTNQQLDFIMQQQQQEIKNKLSIVPLYQIITPSVKRIKYRVQFSLTLF